MWPFNLFKKISQDPPVGETRGDYIGCYLLGTQTTGRDDDISYISLATTREQLERDAREFLEQFLHDNPQARTEDREAVQQLLAHLGPRIDEHLAQGRRQPLAIQGGRELFLRTGMRARRKEKGAYLE